MENTKKGPGRPPHNAHPTTCSGEPIPLEEIERKKAEAEDRKKRKQTEKHVKKGDEKRYSGQKSLNNTNTSCNGCNFQRPSTQILHW